MSKQDNTIPNEEQDIVEEEAERLSELQEGTYTPQHKITYKHGFLDGVNFQKEISYSEDDMINYKNYVLSNIQSNKWELPISPKEWFKQHNKNK